MTFDASHDGRSYLSNLRDYLPSSARMQQIGTLVANSVAAGVGATPIANDSHKPVTPRVVLWKSFEEFEFGDETYLFLVLGLIDGFQIYQIQSDHACRLVAQHSDAPTQLGHGAAFDVHMLNQKAMASTPIGMVRFLTHPTNMRDMQAATAATASTTSAANRGGGSSGPYYGTLLAVCSAEERPNHPRSVLKIYSLAHGAYVHMLRFRSRIFGIHTHRASGFLCVTLENQLHVYRTPTPGDGAALAFECVWSTTIMPNPSPHIMAALSHGNVGPSAGAGGVGGVAPLVNLGPHASSILSTATFSREEWSVLAVGKRWVAYCINEPVPPAQAQQYQAANGSSAASMAQYAAMEHGDRHGYGAGGVMHKSPLFQPINSTPTHAGLGGGGGSGPSAFSLSASLPAVMGGSGDTLANAAKGIASGLYNLGGMGKKSLANYLSGEGPVSGSSGADGHGHGHGGVGMGMGGGGSSGGAGHSSAASSSVLGTVLVRDLETQRIIACIRAHPQQQITHLSFDRSGTLLATVPVDGQYIHVYQVVMVPQPMGMAQSSAAGGAAAVQMELSPQMQARRPSIGAHSATHSPSIGPLSAGGVGGSVPAPVYHTRFLYRLFRGITHASIRDLSFSLDGRFLSAVSTKGTAHLFALNPLLGGDITPSTHGPRATEGGRENALVQQMVTKYTVLSAQQGLLAKGGAGGASAAGANTTAGGGGGAGGDESGLVGLDSFLYQPRVLSSIYRIKPQAPAYSSAPAPPGYTPVIALFARLHRGPGVVDRSVSRRGSSDDRMHRAAAADAADSESSMHHLLVCAWNEALGVYTIQTAYKTPPSESNGSGGGGGGGVSGGVGAAGHNGGGGGRHAPSRQSGGSDGKDGRESESRAKLALVVDCVANFELQPTALSNTMAGGSALSSHSRPSAGVHQPHQQQLLDAQDESTVRILTAHGQEDEMTHAQQQQQQQYNHRSDSPLQLSHSARPPKGPPSFFVQLEPERFSTPPPPFAPAAAASTVDPLPRSALSTHSPIFSTIAGPADPAAAVAASSSSAPAASHSPSTGPRLSPTQLQQQQQAALWLSEVELRTYETSDVPLWASPQLLLCSYDRPAASAPGSSLLYIDKLGSRPLMYDKFQEFAGLSTDIAQPHQQKQQQQQAQVGGGGDGDAAPAASTAIESDISSALSSTLLDDAGFVAALRRSREGSGSDDDAQSSQIFSSPGDGSVSASGGSDSFARAHPLMADIVDEQYYRPAAPTSTTAAGSATSSGASSASPPAPSANVASLVVTQSGFFPDQASDSQILSARLPPSNHVADSALLSPQPPAQSQQAHSPAPPAAADASANPNLLQPPVVASSKAKKKSKSKNKSKAQEVSGNASGASDREEPDDS